MFSSFEDRALVRYQRSGIAEEKGASSNASVIRRSAEAIAEGKGFMNQVVRLRLHYDDDPVDLPHTP